jgi:predicted RNA polymerase sigma factor
VPLSEQDVARWDAALIERGEQLLHAGARAVRSGASSSKHRSCRCMRTGVSAQRPTGRRSRCSMKG